MNKDCENCENCGKPHNGEYGSGRFCSIKCARSFSTKNKRKQINEKVSETLKGSGHGKVMLTCQNCGVEFKVNWNKRNQKYCSRKCSMVHRCDFYSKLAKKTGLGGNRNNYAHGWYVSSFAGKVFLESSYEYKVAMELDNNKINWVRPKPLLYDNEKRYYPDFYLCDYDVYLDPKNDYLIERDNDKINKVISQNNVKIIILNKEELSWEIIKNLI